MWKQFTNRCKAFLQWLKKFWVAAVFFSPATKNEDEERRTKKRRKKELRNTITAKTETKATIQCEVYRDSRRVARERWATVAVSWVRKGEKVKENEEKKTASNTVELSQIFRTKNSAKHTNTTIIFDFCVFFFLSARNSMWLKSVLFRSFYSLCVTKDHFFSLSFARFAHLTIFIKISHFNPSFACSLAALLFVRTFPLLFK